jgi:hypothetical protein
MLDFTRFNEVARATIVFPVCSPSCVEREPGHVAGAVPGASGLLTA